ncbi:MAG: hypothetical protein ACI4Q6_02880, partial [Huintestinicola sp.]
KKGNTSDIKYRKALITLFVNAIYLYDDKMTIVFNSGDEPVTVDDLLLSEIEEHFQQTEKGLFLERVSPPKGYYTDAFASSAARRLHLGIVV